MADQDIQETPTESPPSLLRRLFAPLASLKRRLSFSLRSVAAVLAVIGIAGTMGWVVASRKSEPKEKVTLDAALAKLDEGDYAAAKSMAVTLLRDNAIPFEHEGGPAYILGIIAMHAAESDELNWNSDKKAKMNLLAARYLDQARHLGIPAERHQPAMLALGTCFFLGGQYDQCLPVLEAYLADAKPSDSNRVLGYLATAYLRARNPDVTKARQYSELHLADQSLTEEERADAMLVHSQICLAGGDLAESENSLKQISANAAIKRDVLLMKGRQLLHKAEQMLSKPLSEQVDADKTKAEVSLKAAMQIFNDLQQQHGRANRTAAAAEYLSAVCVERLDELAEAEKLFALARKRHVGTPVAIAAAVGEADVQRRQEKDAVALVSYQRALTAAGESESYNNPWLPLREFRNRIQAAFADWMGQEKYKLAVSLAKSMWPMFPRIQALQMVARAHRTWAESLLAQAAAQSTKDNVMVSQARTQLRETGQSLSELAELRYATREYPTDLWQAATAYFEGLDFRNGVKVLQRYSNSSTDGHLARAKVMLGEAHLALGNLQQAQRALLDCIASHPLDPDTYRARIVAAHIYAEQDDIQTAKDLLLENLENPDLGLRPDSVGWRDSLLAYGKLLYSEAMSREAASRKAGVDQRDSEAAVKEGLRELEVAHGLFQQAIERLSEAIERYSGDESIREQLFVTRYLMAESHRQAAKLPRKRLPLVVIESTRAKLINQINQELTTAAETFHALERDLIKNKDHTPLSEVLASVLRNCYFGRGDALFDMGDFRGAIDAYRAAIDREHAESLEAYLQIASCYRRLGRHKQAQGTMKQARVVLGKIPEDVDFTQTTRFDRQHWLDWLDWLGTL